MKCSKLLSDEISRLKGNPLICKTGHTFIKQKIRETSAHLGGEMSGHIFFNDRWPGFDDGIYAGARMLEIIANSDDKNVFESVPNLVSTPEINIKAADDRKFQIVDQFIKHSNFENANMIDIDGIRVEFKKGWGLLRASNTSPFLVLRFEAETEEELTKIKEIFYLNLKEIEPEYRQILNMAITRKQAENIALVLSEGLPYIQKFKGKIIVVKYGGAAMTDESLKKSFARDIALMKLVGMNPVIIHGGGPQIGKELSKAGLESEFIGGLRVTTKSVMSVVKKILGTQINHEIVRLIKHFGGNAISFNHNKYSIIRATKRNNDEGPDLGYVGKVEKIMTGEIKKKIDKGFIPVIAPIGKSKNNDYWNINADVVAGEVAQSLKAEKLILLTDVKGIGDSENKLISKISLKKGQKVLKEKFIKGGMTPKLTAALEAKKNGVKSCHIIDGRVPHAVLLEVLTEEGVGTMIS